MFSVFRKMICLVYFVLVLSLVGDVQAADVFWHGTTGDHLWSLERKWSSPTVPTSADTVKIISLPGPTIVNEGAVAYGVQLGYGGTTAALTVDGGTLTIGEWITLGSGEVSHGTLNMISGTLTVGNNLFVGRYGAGTLNMTGGTIAALNLHIPSQVAGIGHVNLNGGIISTNNIGMKASVGTMDVRAGTLIIDGDKVSLVQGYIDNGWITAYGGNSTLQLDYDVTNENKTTLKAVYFLNPNPADGDSVSPGEVELSWILPDPCMPGQLVPVDVYFTDDLQLLEQFTDPAAIQVVSKQNVTSVVVQTQLKTWYHWAVDAYVGSTEDPVSGSIFSFFADNIPPTVNGQKYQLGRCDGVVIGDCSFYDADCDDLPNGEDDCNNEVIGCYWVGCTASQTVPCSYYGTDQDFCEFMGCLWDGFTCTGSSGDCNSFDSDVRNFILGCGRTDVPCDVFDCQDDCEYFGCSWLACQGTPTPCSDLSAETCESQFGCYWKDAGKDIVTWLEDGFRTVNLDATITDDGLLYPYTVQWTVIKEPNEGTAVIETATAEDTSITLSAVGEYVLQLEAFDGEYTGSDTVTINVYNLSDYIHFVEDINGGRKVNWNDLELMLENWLQDNSLTEE